jgi:DNA invertase Pin-like site-specific DNA recombinase
VAAYCRVSTMADEQIDSFKSQVAYYTSLINSNPEWENAGIYADEGLSGTQADKRPQFLKMVAAAMNGQIDIILVKSLSRFGRNTVDNLNYIRAFKEKNVAIRFEEEGIDTSKESGEIMITILSSCAQQEVQNTSEHVKTGLKMIMSRGQLIGYNGCLGYDYDKATKSIKVNKEEAKIVRYIFSRYLQGAGTTVLARELTELGYKGKDGNPRWFDSTILGIIKNEKYKGDIVQGKTFTVDPISKRRLRNFGESDQYCIRNHHEAIVSEDDWNKAQEILKQRLIAVGCLRMGRGFISRANTPSAPSWNAAFAKARWSGEDGAVARMVLSPFGNALTTARRERSLPLFERDPRVCYPRRVRGHLQRGSRTKTSRIHML